MKQYMQNVRRKKVPGYIRILLYAAFVLLLGWSVLLIREKLLRNAHQMGMNLAQSYAYEEENRIELYSMLLNIMTSSVRRSLASGTDPEVLQTQLASYSAQMEDMLGTHMIDPYAVIDGAIVAAEPWEGDEDYDYASVSWYQEALASPEEIIYTDVYEDAITGKQVLTLAHALDTEGDVLAFDILVEDFHSQKNRVVIPDASIYFLFDSSDALICYTGDMDTSLEETERYLNDLVVKIRSGGMEAHDAMVTGTDGKNWVVYYYELSNGWLSVITIPAWAILRDDWDSAVIILAIVCAALMAAAGVSMVRNHLGSRQMQQISETLQILGDSYYAIYRVNFMRETYTSVKSSGDVSGLLGQSGSYSHLLDVVKNVVDETTHEEFEQNLSAQNIRRLVENGIYDFGGDYQRRFDGVNKWVNIQVLYSKGLQLDEVILAFREIDAKKRKELQQRVLLENALEAAKKTAQQKTMFFSSASHDMRTPLNAIIGLAKLAQKPGVSREAMDGYMSKIQRSGEQMLTLVNDILDVSRLEHGGENTLDYAPMDICQCIRENVENFREQAAAEHKALELSCDVQHPAVSGDAARLGQILNNLISNAMKYSHEGARIDVLLRECGHQNGYGRYQITVKDTGIGMSEEFLACIFEPFSRETTFSAANVSGTGLGMPIVRSLVQQMDGEITVNSELGKGSTFTVTFPLRTLDTEIRQESVPEQEESYSLEGKTILLAEDNEINMEVATECLAMAGAHVLQAVNGREAVELFRSKEPYEIDAVLMDMQMPVMDGCEAARAIRALGRPDAGTVPIIAVTANVFAEDIAQTTDAGMNAHIAKPIDFEQLQATLQRCIAGKRAPDTEG